MYPDRSLLGTGLPGNGGCSATPPREEKRKTKRRLQEGESNSGVRDVVEEEEEYVVGLDRLVITLLRADSLLTFRKNLTNR